MPPKLLEEVWAEYVHEPQYDRERLFRYGQRSVHRLDYEPKERYDIRRTKLTHEHLVEIGQVVVQSSPTMYVDLDVEADGKPGYGSLLSVGAVSPWGDEFYRELRPTSELYVPSQRDFCESVGLRRERLLDEGEDPAKAMADLADWESVIRIREGKDKSVIAAFNAGFDHGWVDLEMIKAGVTSPFGVAGYCTKSLANFLSNNYDWSQTTKGNLPKLLVPDEEFTHNALEDARWQQRMHFAMVGARAVIFKDVSSVAKSEERSINSMPRQTD